MKKTVLKNSMLMVIMVITMTGFANEMPHFKTEKETPFTLFIDDVTPGQELIIKDQYGIIVYREKIEQLGSYSKEFDLTSLPEGSYFFEMDRDLEINIIPFSVNDNTVVFDKGKEHTIFKPYVWSKNNRIFLSKLSLHKQPLHIIMYYEGDIIFSETLKNTKNIERVYNVLKDKKGYYKVVVKTEGRTFTEYIKI